MEHALRTITGRHRLKILGLIWRQELSAGAIAARFPISRPAVSQHLKALAAAGLAAVRKEGTRRLYRARPERVAELKAFLDAFWEDNLNRLKAEAEAEARRPSDGQDR